MKRLSLLVAFFIFCSRAMCQSAEEDVTAETIASARVAAYQALIQILPKDFPDSKNLSIQIMCHSSELAVLTKELVGPNDPRITLVEKSQAIKNKGEAKDGPRQDKEKQIIRLNATIPNCEFDAATAYGVWSLGTDNFKSYAIKLKKEKGKWGMVSIEFHGIS